MSKIKPFVREKNFLILMTGVFINELGIGIYLIAGMLLVLELSGSVLYSGIAVFATTLPGVLGFLIAPLANYMKYKNGLVSSNFIKALLLFTISLMHYTVGLDVWYLIAVLFLISLLSQFTYPIESTILPIIVGKDNVVDANAYLQTLRQSMDFIFIGSAGIIVALIGSVNALMITGVCIFLVAVTYTFFTFKQPVYSDNQDSSFKGTLKQYPKDLKGGFIYIKGSIIPKMIISAVIINFLMVIMTTNMPAFSLIKGSGNEAVYGFYLAALSLGILAGTIISPKLKHIDFGKMIIFTYALSGVMWLGTALLPLIPSLILFSTGAISISIFNILTISSIQKQVETHYIGRVITLLTSIATIGMPIGALVGGVIGDSFSPVITVIVGSMGMIIFSIYWLSSSVLRKLPNIEKVNLFPERAAE